MPWREDLKRYHELFTAHTILAKYSDDPAERKESQEKVEGYIKKMEELSVKYDGVLI